MKAFVTGGTGFIGSHLVDALLARDAISEVRCLVRSSEKWLSGKPITPIYGDLHDNDALEKGVHGVDVVFHLAGVVMARDAQTFYRANVEATENLQRIAQTAGIPKMVMLSSLAAVGPANGTPVTEQTPMQPVSRYGRSKKQMEERIRQIHDGRSSVSVLRPPAVYGPREDQIFSLFQAMNYRIAPIIGDGERPQVSLVYVDDVVQGCLKAAEAHHPGVEAFFVSGEPVHTWQDVRRVTQTVLGKKTLPLYVKPRWVKNMASVVEEAAGLFGQYPVLNRDKANELVLEWTCSSEKAKQQLEYRPSVSLQEGIARTIHWYKKHNWL